MKRRLQELLDALHAELGDSTGLDEDAKQELKNLARDIETSLAGGDDQGMAAQAMEQIEEATVSFETEYPRLAGILSSIADTLAKLGI